MSRMTDALPKLVGGFLAVLLVLAGGVNTLNAQAVPPNQYGAIYENDGLPGEVAAGTNIWHYTALGGSYGKIIQVRIENVYSLNIPKNISSSANWNMTATDSNNDKLWEITFTATSSYILTNGSKYFNIQTDYAPDSVVQIGNLPGQTKFELGGGIWYTPNISNLWGPTGAAYPVSIVAGSHGVVTPAGTILVGVGGSTNVQAVAEQPGYRLAAIVTNGTVAWTNATGDNAVIATNIAVGPVTQGETVAVYFAAKTYAAPALWGEWTPGGVRVWFGTEAGGGYALEASGTLATNGWAELETLTGTGTLTNLLDATASGWPARFYRVRVSPPAP